MAVTHGHAVLVGLLLATDGANVESQDEDGWSPLCRAASNGFFDVVKLLLENGASLTAVNPIGWAPVHCAADSGHEEVLELLIEHGGDIAATVHGWMPLTMAADKGYVAVVRMLLEKGAAYAVEPWPCRGWTPLIQAARSGNVEVVKMLLEQRPDIMVSSDSWLFLDSAIEMGHVEVVRLLLQYGADTNQENPDGRTPLRYAVECGHEEIVKELVDDWADPMAADDAGTTAAHIAAHNGRLDLLRLFLNCPGFDIDLEDNNGRTALFHAAMRGHDHVVSALLSRDTRGASEVEEEEPFVGQEEEPFVGPLFANLTGNVQDCFGALPIFAAARNGHTRVVETLFFADPSCLQHKDWFGHSLVWWAFKSGKRELVLILLEYVVQHGIRIPTHDLVLESNPAGFDPRAPWCHVCTRCTVYRPGSCSCELCDGGASFIFCGECYNGGVWCRDPFSHSYAYETFH